MSVKLSDRLAYAASALLDLLLPRRCVVCGRVLSAQEKHICLYCSASLPETYFWLRESNPMAERLNGRIQLRLEQRLSVGKESCGSAEPGMHEPYAYAAALFFYRPDSPYNNITKSLKYRADLSEGRHFSEMLGRRLASSPLYADVDLVVPVPLHRSRRLRRGYNQAEVVARGIASRLPLSPTVVPGLLRRSRRTRSQTRLSLEQKASNVRGAFCADSRLAATLKPRHILIVDDVFTSGATLSECHAALRSCWGPSVRISVATLACVE